MSNKKHNKNHHNHKNKPVLFNKENKIVKKIVSNKKSFSLASALLIVVSLSVYYWIYNQLNRNNYSLDKTNSEVTYLLVPTDIKYDSLLTIIDSAKVIKDFNSFKRVSKWLELDRKKIHSGRYKLQQGMSNKEIINLFIEGSQTPIKLTFNNFRTKEQLASFVGKKLEMDSLEFISKLLNPSTLVKLNLTKETVFTIFLPNTYEVYWNTTPDNLIDKLHKEYLNFWNQERLCLANELKMTPTQVMVLASIVYSETKIKHEMPEVAGVYLNRLRKGMKLDADPTVVFAWGDFSVNRVKGKMLRHDSPYNTYLYGGLPPGPICMPSVDAIDAVLQNMIHNYIYFCANPDWSGTHIFADNIRTHQNNANRFKKELNKRGIKK